MLSFVWTVLVLGFGLEATAAFVRGEWWQFAISLAGAVALIALILHWKRIRAWPGKVYGGWLAASCVLLIVVLALSPFVEEKRWPFSAWFPPAQRHDAAPVATVSPPLLSLSPSSGGSGGNGSVGGGGGGTGTVKLFPNGYEICGSGGGAGAGPGGGRGGNGGCSFPSGAGQGGEGAPIGGQK